MRWDLDSASHLPPPVLLLGRIRIRGKLLRNWVETDLITVAKLRLADLEKAECQTAENKNSASDGRITAAQAMTH